MNIHPQTPKPQSSIPYTYALKMFLGWSICAMGSMLGFIGLLHRYMLH